MSQTNQELKKFLEVLFPSMNENERIEVRMFLVKGNEGKIKPQQYFYENVSDVLKAHKNHSAMQSKGYGVYFGVCPRIKNKGNKASVSRVQVLWADLDDKNFGGDKQKALKCLNEFKLKPTIIVDSGHGYHAYWKLKDSQTDTGLVESCLKGIANAVNADFAVCETARVMRLPNTVNNKEEKSPVPVHIVEINESAIYEISDFKDFINKKATNDTPKTIGSNPILKGGRNSVLASLAGSLFKRSLDYPVVLEMLRVFNKMKCLPVLSDVEVKSVAKSIQKTKLNSEVEKKYFTINQLKALKTNNVDWVWEGYLAKGYITLLSGWPKAGKTTLLFELITALKNKQPFLGFNTKQEFGKILIITEENSQLYQVRIEKAKLSGDDVFILPGFETECKSKKQVQEQIELAIEKENLCLIILDTLGEFWGVMDESSAPMVQGALKSFRTWAQNKNLSILLIHHLRKSDGEYGTAHRGSGALLGAVDIGLEFKYSKDKVPNRRTISAKSRFHQTPEELMIELEAGKYKALGSPAQFETKDVKKRFLEALSESKLEELEEIRQKMTPIPSEGLLREIAKEHRDAKLVDVTGKGVKGNPYQYKKLKNDSI